MRAAAQLLAGRSWRWVSSSTKGRHGAGISLRGGSIGPTNRTIVTLGVTESFLTAAMTPTTKRRRQRSIAISIPSIGVPSSVGIRSRRTFSGTKTTEQTNDSKRGSNHPISSPPPSSADDNNRDKLTATSGTESPQTATTKSAIPNPGTSDPSMVTWVDDYLPPSLRPYAHLSRMDKPIGTWLLLWPCYWSTALAAGVVPAANNNAAALAPTTLLEVLPDPKLLALFTTGAFVMRGAGCTINDLWDRDLDGQVARTKTRPLAAGILTPTRAVGWLALQLSAGLGVLVSLPHTHYCFAWGAASLPLVVAYPLMKRFFDYPQLVLGLCFNWGAFMGWAAVHGGMDYAVVLPLYASGVAWTMGYDTLYAHQDKEDDAKLGLKSTALTFGRFATGDDANDEERTHKRVLHALAATTYACWLGAGYPALAAPEVLPYALYAVGVTGAYAHLVWQIRTADLNDPHNLAERFRSNATVGGIVFGSIVAGKLATVLG